VGAWFQLTVDCRDPSTLVAFWAPLLGYEVPVPPQPHATWRDWYVSLGVPPDEIEGDGTDRLVPGDGQGVALWFQSVPEQKSVKNRLHLDLRVSQGRSVSRTERRAAIEPVMAQVLARGGSLVRWAEDEAADHVYAVMADPEGNEFCLV
jgi:catechol 2,3-dioxygenase-like lactoylglutathione lyase family enzyme